eukprot:TRINITY_DN2718_c0_g1_i2.p1 TRINITY_DN2718_c0_g1~~TRINITY_DN2718_c0_g1_i2.p1  ORF type:complete len:224 (-),score=27.47 TRINITY_DN2718_c0_g1_i2:492-1163(-)
MSDLTGKIALVTGGSSGIGRSTAKGLAKLGAHVILTSRSLERGEEVARKINQETNAKVDAMALDTANFASVREFAKIFQARYNALHILVNNAGIGFRSFNKTADGFEEQFQTNHLGPFLLTNLLLDLIKKSAPARIVFVSSGLHFAATKVDLEDLVEPKAYHPAGQYQITKVLNILHALELQRRIDDEGYTITDGTNQMQHHQHLGEFHSSRTCRNECQRPSR